MYLKHTLLPLDSSWYSSYEVTLDIQPEILPFNQLNDIVAIVKKILCNVYDIYL